MNKVPLIDIYRLTGLFSLPKIARLLSELGVTEGGMTMIQGLVDQLMQDAQRLKVSDIYVLPGPVGYQVRLRRAQGIVVWRTIDQPMGQRLLTYFKFHADMTVSEQRRPQVGALTWRRSRSPVDLRFSTVGDYTGRESMVIA